MITAPQKAILIPLAIRLGGRLHVTETGFMGEVPFFQPNDTISAGPLRWNPLSDIGDAATLAIKHKVSVSRVAGGWQALVTQEGQMAYFESYESEHADSHDPSASAYCFAICNLLLSKEVKL